MFFNCFHGSCRRTRSHLTKSVSWRSADRCRSWKPRTVSGLPRSSSMRAWTSDVQPSLALPRRRSAGSRTWWIGVQDDQAMGTTIGSWHWAGSHAHWPLPPNGEELDIVVSGTFATGGDCGSLIGYGLDTIEALSQVCALGFPWARELDRKNSNVGPAFGWPSFCMWPYF